MSRCLRVVAAGRLECVPLARRIAAQALTRVGLPGPVVDDALVCVSELVTNAVRHSASGRPGGAFRLAIDVEGGRLLIQVADQGGPTEPVTLPATGEATGGRGLPIIASLGALRVDGDVRGRRVTALLPLRPSSTFEVNP